MSSLSRKLYAKRQVNELLSAIAKSLIHLREPFWRIAQAVQSSSTLITPFNRQMLDTTSVAGVARALSRIVRQHDRWVRSPEDWVAPIANPAVQFRSLVCHLFDQFEVPRFMSRVWLSEDERQWDVDLYLHLAAGRSIRKFDLPAGLLVTKRSAALFMQAPDDLSPVAAIRWAHMRSLGCEPQLARELISKTMLAGPTEEEPFWDSAVRFLVQNQPITLEESVAIISFVHSQKFLPANRVWGPGEWEIGAGLKPLQPNFTLRGRTLSSLRQHMANWRSELLSKRVLPQVTRSRCWDASGFSPMTLTHLNSVWTIQELRSHEELCVEGGVLQHCVATYASSCRRRFTSIWSLRVQSGTQSQRVLTVEVLPRKGIIWQAKGKKNSEPSREAREVLQIWANKENLQWRKGV